MQQLPPFNVTHQKLFFQGKKNFFNFSSMMANWVAVDIIKRSRARYELTRFALGTVFLFHLFVFLVVFLLDNVFVDHNVVCTVFCIAYPLRGSVSSTPLTKYPYENILMRNR